MSWPPRTKGEILPAPNEELAGLKRQTESKIPVGRQCAMPLNAHVVPSRRGTSGHAIVRPPPGRADDNDEVVIEMSGDDEEDDPRPLSSRCATLEDPMTTKRLAESVRDAAPPPAPTPAGPNRHIKRR